MKFTHFMGGNSSSFHNGMQNYDAQCAPWVSSHFPIDMPSPFQSSPWSTYMNTSIGSGRTMALIPTSSFDLIHVPQPTLTVGGWNPPSYVFSPSYALLGVNTQINAYPSNTFPMVGPHISLGISYIENQFYDSGYPLYGTPSQGGNIYPHLNNTYHTPVSSQTSVMMPIHTSLDHSDRGYYLFGQGQGVN
jgi:hypothetical protein